jgi:FkbM family methyltransferase
MPATMVAARVRELSKTCGRVGEEPACLPRWLRRCFSMALRLPRGGHRALRLLAEFSPAVHQLLIGDTAVGECYLDLRETICTQLFCYGRYPHQSGQDRLLRRLLSPGQKVFDIGANIGFYTRLFSEAVGPAGMIVAVEPAPRALRLLELNASLCGAAIQVVAKAVGASEGRARFVESKNLDLSYCTSALVGRTVEVESTTIDCLRARWGMPDLIKIDVEGFENAVLEGARGTLDANDAPIVMFEHIADLAARCRQGSLRDAIDRFPAGRYRVFRVAADGSLAGLDCTGAGLSHDYLAVPIERLGEVIGEAA